MLNKSILLIDDHAMFRSGMRLLLLAGMQEVQVFEASSLEQALNLNLPTPDVILLDIQLQGINGLQGMGLIKRQWPEVPVVMLSSANDADTIRLCMERGAAAFVSKADTDKKIIRIIEGPDAWGLIRIEFKIKYGRKLHTFWCYPEDLKEVQS
jgi:DNA-binding NarL/FixJ family response regulator